MIQLVAAGFLLSVFLLSGIHEIEQGHRGVYYRGGSLLVATTQPGYNYKYPGITSHHNVQVTVQTDKLWKVPCGSSQGGTAHLDIEVVNRLLPSSRCVLKAIAEYTTEYDKPLIFDYIPSEVAQFCKNYSIEDIYIREFDKLDEVLLAKLKANVKAYGMDDCLEVQRVRIGRPTLSAKMQARFEAIEHEQKDRDLQKKRMETEKVKLDIQLQHAKMTQQRKQEEMQIDMETAVQKEKKQAEIALIASDKEAKQAATAAESERLKALKIADAEAYRAEKQADGIAHQIKALGDDVKSFLEWHKTSAYWNSSNKVYYFADSKDHMPRAFYGGHSSPPAQTE